MKNRAARPDRKPRVLPQPRPNSRRTETGESLEPKSPRAPSRSSFMRLAAEVEALAAQLKFSRERIADLEARVDIDSLTDVLNRRGFERELKRSLAYVKRYGTSAALIYVDLDGFKPVNDRHGHAAGDAVLKAVAAALLRHVRASDVVARIGGDEFAVLLWNVDDAAADEPPALRAAEVDVFGAAAEYGCATGRAARQDNLSAAATDDATNVSAVHILLATTVDYCAARRPAAV